ncbi:diguanylate cyclase [Pseudoalteromonas sp.]|uniref:diguanylate cyclase n=1 Tax=Pseudoalteromonas sp. TaxID=53249 RepID=UPI003561B374
MLRSVFTTFGYLFLNYLCLLSNTVQASHPVTQQIYQFSAINEPVGARQASVYHVTADQRDIIWLATDTDGLVRYDGKNYQVWADVLFAQDEYADISKLLVSNNTIWAATWGKGLFRWDSSRQLKTHYQHTTPRASISNDHVQTLFTDSQKRLWIGTLTGLNYLHTDQPNVIHSLPEDNPLSSLRIWWLQESQHAIWVATSHGVYRLAKDLSDWQQFLINPSKTGQSRSNEIRTIELINDALWVGTNEGLFIFNPHTAQFTLIDLDNQPNARVNIRVNDIIADSAMNTVLVGTNRGLHQLDASSLKRINQTANTPQLAGVDIRSLFFDKTQGLWVGTREQGLFKGIKTLPLFTDLLTAPRQTYGLTSQAVKAVHYSHTAELWLATEQGVFQRVSAGPQPQWHYVPFPTHYNVHDISVLFVDSEQQLWVGTNEGVFQASTQQFAQLQQLSRYTEFSQLELTDVQLSSIYADGDDLLFGIRGQGIARYSTTSKRFSWVDKRIAEVRGNIAYAIFNIAHSGLHAATRYSGLISLQNSDPVTKIPTSAPLLCAHSYPESTLWVCSNEGLWRINGDTGEVSQYSEQQGFPSKRILGATHDEAGFLWVTTHQGLVRFNPSNETIRTIGLTHGLIADSFTERGIARSANGKLAIASPNGAFEFNPTEIKIDEAPFDIRLSQIFLGQQDITPTISFNQTAFSLAHDHTNINLHFTVTDYREPNKNLYRYRLNGPDAVWSEWRRDNQLLLASLPIGVNVLTVEGKNSQGRISATPLQLTFNVSPPWWMNAGTISLLLVTLVVIVYGGIRLRTQRLAALTKQLEHDVAERTQQLEQANSTLRQLVDTDYLTGLNNRRGFVKAFTLTQQQRRRTPANLAILLLDVDYFKKFNDNYGHQKGDECLKLIATTLTNTLREQDIVARWGGEEFVVMLPNTSQAGALTLAEKLRHGVEQQVSKQLKIPTCATVTIGLVANLAADKPLELWLQQADQALYQGKAAGRNQVVAYSE